MAPAIEATGVVRRFGTVTALDGVDLEVAPGTMFGLIGPNGAGKTTLLQILAAVLDPTAGRARVLGHDVVEDAARLHPRIGYVAQEFTLYGALSVDENLDFFADLYGVPARVREERKEELLRWSRLAQFRGRRAGRLSGGMQKKLHLCSTLIHAPELLLLDEPTNGVDPMSRRELWEILHDVAGRGLTLVVATPYMDEAEQCDRVALIHRGRIRAADAPERLRHTVPGSVWELRAPALARARDLLAAQDLPLRSHLMGDRLHIVAGAGADLAGELRARLAAALGDLLADGHAGAIAVDSDTPSLPTAFLQMAVDRLGDPAVDVVLGPSEDGGYYLIGMKRVHDALFTAMPWSTPRVLAETERRARAAGLALARLPGWFDVDTADDLARLGASLARGEGAPAPATRALLEAWAAPAPP